MVIQILSSSIRTWQSLLRHWRYLLCSRRLLTIDTNCLRLIWTLFFKGFYFCRKRNMLLSKWKMGQERRQKSKVLIWNDESTVPCRNVFLSAFLWFFGMCSSWWVYRYILEQILSGEPTEIVVENIHDYLTKIGGDTRNGLIKLDEFIIFKVRCIFLAS